MRQRQFTAVAFSWLLVTSPAAGAVAPGRWETLGRVEINFRSDRDRIEVGRHEGRFKQLRFRVEGAPVEIYDVIVTFRNKETFRPALRHRFEGSEKVRVIDLPGERRAIRHVDFHYRSTDLRKGKARLILSGR
ncbi:MAG TPA: hypothetical protein VNN77_00715 [candidate division Zixibacteria bacterium]|nr:hypothetical protein [candidate division Zixibacteria bacterium]